MTNPIVLQQIIKETVKELESLARGDFPEIEGYNGAYVNRQAVIETAENALLIINKLQKTNADLSWSASPDRSGGSFTDSEINNSNSWK